MKEAPDTLPPIAAKQPERGALRRMLFGHAAAGAYYEALDSDGRWYLWMEFSRFGSLRAYPCVLIDGDATLVYRPFDADNSAMLQRWQALLPEGAAQTLRITELTKAEFQKIYRSYREA